MRKYWAKILILLFLVSTAYLLLSYYQESQRRDDLQQKIDDLANRNAILAISTEKRQPEASAEQLVVTQKELESSLNATKEILTQSLITNDHVQTIIHVAEEENVHLSTVKAADPNICKIESVPFNVMTMKIEVEGSTLDAKDFISHVCKAFQTGIVKNVDIKMREDPEKGRLLLLNLDLDIYSYAD